MRSSRHWVPKVFLIFSATAAEGAADPAGRGAAATADADAGADADADADAGADADADAVAVTGAAADAVAVADAAGPDVDSGHPRLPTAINAPTPPTTHRIMREDYTLASRVRDPVCPASFPKKARAPMDPVRASSSVAGGAPPSPGAPT